MKEFLKHHREYDDFIKLMEYIESNAPKKKKDENTVVIKNEAGEDQEIVYTVTDVQGVIHKFSWRLSSGKFLLKYVSIGEHEGYVEDDLDSM